MNDDDQVMTEYYKNLILFAIIYYIVLLVSRLAHAVLADTGASTCRFLSPSALYCAAGPAKRWRAAAASHKKNYTKTDISRPTNKKVMYFAILVLRGESIATQQGAGLVGKASIDGKK